MAVTIIDTLAQKNNGEFGIVDSNNIIGGFYQTDTLAERDSIPIARRKEGMFCWVGGNEKKVYQLVDGIENTNWIEFKSGTSSSGGAIIDGYAHIWVGDTPPEDTSMIWLDTSSDGILDDETDITTVNKLLKRIAEMENTIVKLTKRVSDLEKGIIIPPSQIAEVILLEDGTELLLEDGTEILLEGDISEYSILLEDGTELLLEDGSGILLENDSTTDTTDGIISSYDSVTETLSLTSKTMLKVDGETLIITSNNSNTSNETLKP